MEEPRDEEWYHCSECGGVASPAEWEAAWVRERDRRKDDPDYQDPIEEWPATNWGLDDRMVCPHCGFDHADNDASMVDSVPPPAESPPVGEGELARLLALIDREPDDGDVPAVIVYRTNTGIWKIETTAWDAEEKARGDWHPTFSAALDDVAPPPDSPRAEGERDA